MVSIQSSFSLNQHGFRFINHFDSSFEYQLPFIGKVKLGEIVYGLCGGMCFAALDYYYTGRPVPEYSREEDFTVSFSRYLRNRQLDSMMLPTIPKIIEWMLRDDHDVLGLTLQREIPKLRRSLDKGDPVVLALVRVHGSANPTANHQALAVGYDFDPDTKDMTIHLYDPNYPEEQPVILLNTDKVGEGSSVSYSTGEAVRGFFIIKYKREKPPER